MVGAHPPKRAILSCGAINGAVGVLDRVDQK
jgi:hypothetical protein